MNVTLIGASGFIGSALLQEALARGHQVKALVRRPEQISPQERLQAVKADVFDADALTGLVRGSDAVITAFSGHSHGDVRNDYLRGLQAIVKATRSAGVSRLLVVGGAGSLYVAPGQQLIDTPNFPAEYKEGAEGARQALNLLRDEEELQWTFLSPAALLQPGPRTGQFRIGGEQLLMDGDAPAHISVADLAVALLDEAEQPQHIRQRFTVAY
jgi:putative NADH-flavin reductase